MMESLKQRLGKLRASVKEEPQEIIEVQNSESANHLRIPALQNDNLNGNQVRSLDPREKAAKSRSNSIYEPLKNQFLNKTLNAQSVIDSLHHAEGSGNNASNLSPQAEGTFKRAESIQANLMNDLKKEPVFYAYVPSNVKNTSSESNFIASPFVQNDCNSVYSFQASAENVKNVMIDSNPYRDIPYKVQNIGKMIGADLETIKQGIVQEPPKKRKITPILENAEQSKIEKAEEMQAVKECFDKGTQTTCNTGDLRLELTSDELENLSEEKKLILLEFYKAFNISECRKISSIKERLQHRLANQAQNRRVLNQIIAPVPHSYGPPL